MYKNVFAAALITIVKNWKQLKCPSIREWTNKLLVNLSIAWMNLTDDVLTKRSHTQKGHAV